MVGHTPLERAGELQGWSYLLMERRRGEPLTAVWQHLLERQRLATELGEALSALHAIRSCCTPRSRASTC
jgi:hygromycin-B 7''-O-kinase